MAKVKIYVEKAFKLLGDDGKHTDYPVGNHTVEKETAEHWFVKAHTGDEPPSNPEMDAELEKERAALKSAGEFLEGKAKELVERENALKENHGILQSIREEQEAKALALAEREKAAEQRETDLNARAEALDTREVAIAEREKAVEAAAKKSGNK